MTKEQLEKANSLKDEIDSGEGITAWIDREHQYEIIDLLNEIIDLLKKWKDEYEKELEEI